MVSVDLHTHTSYGSVCSSMTPGELIQQARMVGLDGVCITEHGQLWDPRAIKKLKEENDFLVISGVEVDTDCGHMLAFGLRQPVYDVCSIEELRRMVDEVGGVMVAAHPFPALSAHVPSNISGIGLTVEEAAGHALFRFVDAIEVYNGLARVEETDFIVKVSKHLNMKATGGSDAHAILGVGSCFTVFEDSIRAERDLIAAIKRGTCRGVDRRSQAPSI